MLWKKTKEDENWGKITVYECKELLWSFRLSSYILIEHKSEIVENNGDHVLQNTEGRGVRVTTTIRAHYTHGWKCHNETPYFVKLIRSKIFK